MLWGAELFRGVQWGRGVLTGLVSVWTVTAFSLAMGFLAKALQDPIDKPLFDRIARAGNTSWTDKVETITKMGNVPQTQVWTAVLAVVLAVWFAARGWRWWVPLVVCPMTWATGRWVQRFLAKIVDRDQDLTSLIGTPIGNYPSGGCARIILVTGIAAFLVVHYARVSRRTTVLLFGGVAVLGLVEAYARARLNQHWVTDVVAGEIFGWLLLGALVLTIRAFEPHPPGGLPSAASEPAPDRVAA